MLQQYSRLNVADNTGALQIMVIQPVAGKHRIATLGDTVTATVKRATPNGQVKKSQVIKAVIVRQRKPFKRQDGTTVSFSDNAGVIISPDGTPVGTRVIGPIAKEVRDRGFLKIAQLAKEVV